MTPHRYTESHLTDSESREHSFSRWLAPRPLQASVEFNGRIGLVPIYAEHQEGKGRYVFWQPPTKASIEVRSGRSEQEFKEYDRRASDAGRELLSLHISQGEDKKYSAVWVSIEAIPKAVAVLETHGISKARREQ